MTDQKPNCGTCPYFPDDEHCPIEYPTDQYNAQRITSLCGCIINPDARVYLMAGVIKELEQRVQEIPYGCNEYIGGIEQGMNIAISLIKGVK